MPELLWVLALLGLILAVSLPAARALRNHGRAAAGVRVLAGELRRLRGESVARRRGLGLAFQRDATGWYWHVVEDGNGNGLRTAEIRRGVDRRLSGPHRLEQRVERASLGFPGTGPYPEIPPGGGTIGNLDDPIKFGRSDVVSFTPLGRSSSGTLYVTDGDLALYGLVLFGPSTRIRVWRLDPRTSRWSM